MAFDVDGLSGRVVLVTGGWRGIGRACVESFLRRGACVAFTFVPTNEPIGDINDFVAGDAATRSAHALDLRCVASIEACVAGVLERWGRIDVLVNNAAVGSATVSSFGDTAAAQDSAMLLINADGTLKMCQAFVDAAAVEPDRHRSIINISSVGGGVTQFPGFRLSDGMSKAAVAMLTRQLAAEHVHTSIDVFAVCPGATNTAMFQASTLDAMAITERMAFEARLPKGRLIEPGEIADVVSFLASRQARVLHGAVIDASMGLGVRPGLMTEHPH